MNRKIDGTAQHKIKNQKTVEVNRARSLHENRNAIKHARQEEENDKTKSNKRKSLWKTQR